MSSSNLLDSIASRPSPLVSCEELEALMGASNLKLFDVRGTWKSPARALPDEFAKGHIPGAIFLDWTKHFLEQDVEIGLASVADEAGARQAFQALGIQGNDLVVLYDDYHHMLAGRIWWAMRYWGFDKVRVLDGGWNSWTGQQRPMTRDVSDIARGTFEPVQRDDLGVDVQDILAEEGGQCLIDARGPINYAGSADNPRSGHIPGAVNVPYGQMLDKETGMFLPNEALAAVFDAAAPTWRDQPIVTTCGSGYAATVTLLALTQLGRRAPLFDGSFSVWKQDDERPVMQTIQQ